MSTNMEAALQQIITTIAPHGSIRAIGLSAGERPLPEAGQGDIDLFVYCTSIPTREQRQELLAPLQEVQQLDVGKLAGGHWGQGDCFLLEGVETWLLYFTLAGARAELESILSGQFPGRLDSYYYPIGRCAMWQGMRALYDPDGFLASLKQRLQGYPPALAQALLEHHLSALEDVEDLERAVRRRDVFFFHFALDLALDHFLQALFAGNREYFPSRKRTEMYLRGFRDKPPECEARLRQVVALGGSAETLEQAYELWQGLVRDLKLLGLHSNGSQLSLGSERPSDQQK